MVEEPQNGEIPVNHKRVILEAIAESGKEARTIGVLVERAHRMGLDTDTHNIAHVIWSLQKNGYVRFTERKGAGGVSVLEHIALRPQGRSKLSEMRWAERMASMPAAVEESNTSVEVFPPVVEAAPPVVEDIEIVPVIDDRNEAEPVIEEFPLIRKLVDRQTKIGAAARLLDEAGLVDEALALLEKNIYTDFENEVIKLWRRR